MKTAEMGLDELIAEFVLWMVNAGELPFFTRALRYRGNYYLFTPGSCYEIAAIDQS